MGLVNCCFKHDPVENGSELKKLEALESCSADAVEWLALDDGEARCKVIDIYDADTVTVIVPFCESHFKVKCRLSGIDAAELRTKNEEEKKVGYEGKKFLSDLILNKVIWIRFGGWGKYGGRMIGTLFLTLDDMMNERSVNNMLIEKGYAYHYDGKTKKRKFDEWHIV